MRERNRCECGAIKRRVAKRCNRCWVFLQKLIPNPHMWVTFDGEPIRVADQSDEGRYS